MVLTKLLRDERGSAATEYALFLALVVGAATFGADLLGLAARQAFADTATSLKGKPIPAALAPAPEKAATVVVAAQPVMPVHVALSAEEIAEIAERNDQFVQFLQLGVIGVSLVSGGIIWYLLYYRKSKQRKESLKEGRQQEVGLSEAIFRKRQDILHAFEADLEKLLSSNVQVGHIMSRNICTVAPHTKVAEVRELMQSQRMRHVLVVDLDRRLLGVISDRDLSKKNVATAADLMTAKPYTVAPSMMLSPAITLLVKECISCLPVVQGEKLVGIFTTTDVLVTLQCALQTLQKANHDAAHSPTTAAPLSLPVDGSTPAAV